MLLSNISFQNMVQLAKPGMNLLSTSYSPLDFGFQKVYTLTPIGKD